MSKNLNYLLKVIVERVGARLEEFHFKKWKGGFRLISGDGVALIEFQKSTKSSDDALLFTVNVGVVISRLLEGGDFSVKKASVIDAHVRWRIGALLPENSDKWWKVSSDSNLDDISNEVEILLVSVVVPVIVDYLDEGRVVELWRSGRSPGLTEKQRAHYLAKIEALR